MWIMSANGVLYNSDKFIRISIEQDILTKKCCVFGTLPLKDPDYNTGYALSDDLDTLEEASKEMMRFCESLERKRTLHIFDHKNLKTQEE